MYWLKLSIFAIFLIANVKANSKHGPSELPEPIYDAAKGFINTIEDTILTGGRDELSAKEKQADDILKQFKSDEFAAGLAEPSTYAPGMHFFHAKDIIDASPIFKMIQKMPKGAVLHGHNVAMTSSEWVIQNLTYWPNLLRCDSAYGFTVLAFREADWHGCSTYVNVVQDRNAYGDNAAYDAKLKRLVDLYREKPEIDYPYIDAVWSTFQNMFGTTADLTSYLPAFIAYHNQLLLESLEDGITYIEFRTSFANLYDDTGKVYSVMESADVMKQVFDEFTASHPDFIGTKVIYSPMRNVDAPSIQYSMDQFKELYAKYPNWVMGYDLVGQEDKGEALINFLPQLRELPEGARYFFHAGETNWYGTTVDENLIDALLLGTTRIGHGYAITKHPVVMEAVKRRNICVEVSPLSNQVLHLVQDLRNHPANQFTANDIPFVISNDDPGFWNAKGLSYDFYYAFMSFSPKDAGIAYLRKLVLKSFECSILYDTETDKALTVFNKDWDNFLNFVIAHGSADGA